MGKTYEVTVLKAEDGYTGWIEEIPGAIGEGDTIEELEEDMKDAVVGMLDYYSRHGGVPKRKREATLAEPGEVITKMMIQVDVP